MPYRVAPAFRRLSQKTLPGKALGEGYIALHPTDSVAILCRIHPLVPLQLCL